MINRKEINADLLVPLANLLFRRVPVQEVFCGNIQYNAISCQTLANLMMEDETFNHHYTAMECLFIAQTVSDYICDQAETHLHDSLRGFIHVFDLLTELLYLLLTEENGVVCCRYQELLPWRRLTRSLGEEFPVTTMYALYDMDRGHSGRTRFSWGYTISHNNKQLNNMVRRGIAEHHYHIWGSTPYFQVSWISLMNHLTESSYVKHFEKLHQENVRCVSSRQVIDQLIFPIQGKDTRTAPNPWAVLQLQAALIRLYLCTRLTGKPCLRLSKYDAPLQCGDVYKLLSDPDQLLMETVNLQAAISARAEGDGACADYALRLFQGHIRSGEETYESFAGERWFMYQMLTDIYHTAAFQRLTPSEHNLFYAYLLLRGELRFQLVQSNDLIGFDNFDRIQNHKWDFIGDATSEQWVTRLAIREPLVAKPYLKELEIRLSPAQTAEQNQRLIAGLEKATLGDGLSADQAGEFAELRSRFYYVFHFIKAEDTALREVHWTSISQRSFVENIMECRHYRLRIHLRKQMWGIVEFRNRFPLLAARVWGIDACAQEIGCRPEVFGTVYRLLGQHVSAGNEKGVEYSLPALGKTYHVGEDFLDLIDGLRAINEAVCFLNLDCGDRLGHGVALGTDVEKWYASKNYRVTLPVQDLLDNLAWFYHALQHYHIPESDLLRQELRNEFNYWFSIVYQNHIDETAMHRIMLRAEQEYADDEKKRNYHVHTCSFDIDTYYMAWTLRGDCPDLYKKGYYSISEPPLDDWDRCSSNQLFPAKFDTRYIAECSLLNYYYHFDPIIKAEGNRRVSTTISKAYVRGAKAVQVALRNEIAMRGISIEVNPSSNVLISTFRKYEEHPILAFYNKGLPLSQQEKDSCPQLHVSINTDDKGVFYTDLENEYALLARSLEQIQDEKENQRFKKNDIYAWLDDIRVMGLEQGFQGPCPKDSSVQAL